MLKTYFYTLLCEFSTIVNKFGFKEAIFSEGLLVDIVPGIVMSLQFLQLELLKFPCALVYGKEYSIEEKEDHIQRLIIIYNQKNNNNKLPWENLEYETGLSEGDEIKLKSKKLVNNLYLVSFPNNTFFTDSMISLANNTDDSIHILTVADHKEIQMRVSFLNIQTVNLLNTISGIEFLYNFELPVDGTNNKPWISTVLCVQVYYLLECIRKVQILGGKVDMIYDYYKPGKDI